MASTQTELLPNGLTLAVETQPWNPGVALQLLIPAGAVGDPEGLEGSASLLEGWLWKGAGSRDARALADAFDDLGVRRGSSSGLEYASFAASFLAEKLGAVLGLYADVLRRPCLADGDLEPVRQIALQELAAIEDQPSKKMFTALRRAKFRSAHGRNPGGSRPALEAASPAALRADFHARYSPRGAILALVGGVSLDQAREAVLAALGDWDGPPAPLPEVVTAPPHSLSLWADSAQVQIGLIYPDVSYGHPEFYTARLAVQVLSGGSGSRLFTEVREKRGLVYSVYATPSGVRGYSYMSAYAGTTPERAEETLEVMRREIEGLADITEGELERIKVGLRASLVMQDESSRSRAASMVRDLFGVGRVRTLEEIEAGIESVDVGRINRYVREFPYRNPWVATLGPKR